MTFTEDLFIDFGVMINVASQAKKRAFCIVLLQAIEHPGSYVGCGSVVETEKDFLKFPVEAPGHPGHQAGYDLRRTNNEHLR
jgi:hypothetical protein